ncbi:hypothetical protein DFH09DRAFT_1077283 [Mycena vulgaris]|nr:hypothetical protein DFH09DRAFT_1077283 [Mycena vulgaris]
MARDPKKWVQSPKRAWYWRHETQSYWKGPRDDHMWPPPDDEDDEASPPSAIAQFGLVPTTLGKNPVVAPWSSTSGGPAGAAAPATLPPPAANESPRNLARRSESCAADRAPIVERGPRPQDTKTGAAGTPGLMAPRSGTVKSKLGVITGISYPGRTRCGSMITEGRTDVPKYDDRRSDAPRYLPRADVRGEYGQMHGPEERQEGLHAETHAHQERARDQALRERALTSHPSTSTTSSGHNERAPRIIINVDHASLDANSPPVFPVRAIEDDESNYGDSKDDDEDGRQLKKYRAREEAQLTDVARRPSGAAGPVPSLPPAPSGAGLWGNLQFSTVPEARNLIQWMMGGCPRARAMFLHLICFYGGSPRARRPDGIQYILREQNRAEYRWLHTTTGDSTPMSRRAEAGKEPPRPQSRIAPPMQGELHSPPPRPRAVTNLGSASTWWLQTWRQGPPRRGFSMVLEHFQVGVLRE